MDKENKSEKQGINALISFDAIMTVVDCHRPFEPSDFIKEYYVADI
jgi:hypothetical protein